MSLSVILEDCDAEDDLEVRSSSSSKTAKRRDGGPRINAGAGAAGNLAFIGGSVGPRSPSQTQRKSGDEEEEVDLLINDDGLRPRRPSVISELALSPVSVSSRSSSASSASSSVRRRRMVEREEARSYRSEKSSLSSSRSRAEQKGLSNEQKAEFKELFSMVDKDGGGSIDRDELRKLLDTIKVFPTEEELNLIFDQIDNSKDDDIQYEEFVQFMSGEVIKVFDCLELTKCFQMFMLPNDPPGRITLRTLRNAFSRLIPEKFPSERHLDDLFQHLPIDERGGFDFQTYIDTSLAK